MTPPPSIGGWVGGVVVVQVNFRGQVLGEEFNDGCSYQVLSIAGDGQVLIWDTR